MTYIAIALVVIILVVIILVAAIDSIRENVRLKKTIQERNLDSNVESLEASRKLDYLLYSLGFNSDNFIDNHAVLVISLKDFKDLDIHKVKKEHYNKNLKTIFFISEETKPYLVDMDKFKTLLRESRE